MPSKKEVFDSIPILRNTFEPLNKFVHEIEDIKHCYFKLNTMNMQSKITDLKNKKQVNS